MYKYNLSSSTDNVRKTVWNIGFYSYNVKESFISDKIEVYILYSSFFDGISSKLNTDLEEIPSRNTVKEIYTSILSDIETARKLINKKNGKFNIHTVFQHYQ